MFLIVIKLVNGAFGCKAFDITNIQLRNRLFGPFDMYKLQLVIMKSAYVFFLL